MEKLKTLSMILVIIGAVNWGLVGAADIDLVALLLSGIPILMKIVYILVGLAGLHIAYDTFMGEKG